ncbi:MAG TPA: hypothetical protein VMD31_08270, partial [Opitutaceae bacterium]|nr:hypothetical protein [Opitutaceae bacterium]
METISRRGMLTGLAATGATALLARRLPAAETPEAAAPVLAPADRQPARDRLIAYFSQVAPQLLRPPQGILSRPNISPSLPGKQYSATLWDWDTLWTTRGLLRLATLTADR